MIKLALRNNFNLESGAVRESHGSQHVTKDNENETLFTKLTFVLLFQVTSRYLSVLDLLLSLRVKQGHCTFANDRWR